MIEKQLKNVGLLIHGLLSLGFGQLLCSLQIFFVFALIVAVLFFLFFIEFFAVLEEELSLVAVVFLQGFKVLAFESAFIF